VPTLSARLSQWWSGVSVPREPVRPFQEEGTSGTAIVGGYVFTRERNSKLVGSRKHETAADMLANLSVIAAGVRYFLNLVAKAKFTPNPVNDSAEAKAYAEFVEEVMHAMETPWPRIIRRAGLYRFHGFSIQEWTAKMREDGRVGMRDVETRPQFTIEQWDTDLRGTVVGVVQRAPMTGTPIYLPRQKVIYLVDDALTDSPEGMGWMRQLAEPADRLKSYLKQEGMAFQRSLSGIPVGRIPYSAINKAVKEGRMTTAEATSAVRAMEDFVSLEATKEDTALTIDSASYENTTNDGPKQSGVPMWDVSILQGKAETIEALNIAIVRLNHEMARIIGTENLLTGADGAGSLALSQDKTNNMLLAVNACVDDICAQFDKDFIGPLWKLNGFPEDMRPKLTVERIAFDDVAKMAVMLRDLAAAGAVLAPNDPAVDDLRTAMGLSPAPKADPATMTEPVRGPAEDATEDEEAAAAEGEASDEEAA
jgi:hypothetical protein